MKKVITIAAALLILTTSAFAEEKKSEPIGLSLGLDYWSHYVWRGTSFYSGDGAFFPWVEYAVGKTGLKFMLTMELPSELFGDSAEQNDDLQSLDFVVDYSYSFKKLVTVGANVWFLWYYNSKYEPVDPPAEKTDASFFSATVSIAIDALPLTPTLTYSHDFYIDEKFCDDKENTKDFYITFSFGHDFELTKKSKLNLGYSMGYYKARSLGTDYAGISDINFTVKLETTSGPATIYGSMTYTLVPEGDFAGDDHHKWWAAFGASYGL